MQAEPGRQSDLFVEPKYMATRKTSLKASVGFIGGFSVKATGESLKTLHSMIRIPGAMIGAGGGFLTGLVGGGLYKIGKHLAGKGDQTRKLSDYIIKGIRTGYNGGSKATTVLTAIPAGIAGAVASPLLLAGTCITGVFQSPVVYHQTRRHAFSTFDDRKDARLSRINNGLEKLETRLKNWRRDRLITSPNNKVTIDQRNVDESSKRIGILTGPLEYSLYELENKSGKTVFARELRNCWNWLEQRMSFTVEQGEKKNIWTFRIDGKDDHSVFTTELSKKIVPESFEDCIKALGRKRLNKMLTEAKLRPLNDFLLPDNEELV